MAVKKKKNVKPAKKPVAKKVTKKPATKAAAPATAKRPMSATPVTGNLLTPLEDRLVVEIAANETKTAGGIIIPGTVSDKPNRGTVLAKGRGRRNKKGSLRPLDVNVGDEILFAQYSGTPLTLAGREVLILREEDVLGVLG